MNKELELIDKVQEIKKLLYEVAVIIGNREYEIELTQNGWGETPDGKPLEKIPSIEIKIIDRY